tara:strand:- start:338 stop:619 length:282 start_codon:yes stop_codon:yes gene_type:complete
MCALESPKAAKVPKNVEIIVAKKAIITEFLTAPCQFKLVKNSSYHSKEYPSGSKASISLVNVKNGTALNDRGIITKRGNIKKNNTKTQMIQKV